LRAQLVDERSVGVTDQGAHHFGFDRPAQELRLRSRHRVDAAHDRGVLRADVDQALTQTQAHPTLQGDMR